MGLPETARCETKHHRCIDCKDFLRAKGLWAIDAHLVETRSCDFGYEESHRGGVIRAGDPVHDLRIGPGWRRQVRDRISSKQSCTPLMDLLGQLTATALQTLHAALEEREAQREVPRKPPIIDTCIALSSSGPIVQKRWPEFYTKAPEEAQE